MNLSQIPIVVLRGSPFERGRQHGEALRELIAYSVAEQLRTNTRQGRVDQIARSAEWLGRLSTIAPDILEELRGIAAGARKHLTEIFLLSAFEFAEERTSGCTSAALRRTSGSIVGQNWDALPGADKALVAFIHEGSDPRFLTIASAGTLGWVGMNEYGLAFVNNDLILDHTDDGTPSLIVRRLMLQQKRVPDAISVLHAHRHLSGRCFVLGDAEGVLRLAELGPSVGVTDRPVDCLVHTNHPLLSKPAMWEDVEACARIYPSSRSRLRAARQHRLESVDDFRTLLCDRIGAPDAICKSPSQREPTGTAFSVIFDCGRREAFVALGRPHETSYQRIALTNAVRV
jgi:isopenicillin-N N-acyltransferase-like protein